MHWRTHLGKHVWRQVHGKDVLHAPLPEEGDQAARPRAHIQNPAAWPQIRDCFHNLGHPLQSKELQMALRLRSRHGPWLLLPTLETQLLRPGRSLPAF